MEVFPSHVISYNILVDISWKNPLTSLGTGLMAHKTWTCPILGYIIPQKLGFPILKKKEEDLEEFFLAHFALKKSIFFTGEIILI